MSGKKATSNIIPGKYALSVGKPNINLPKHWIWVKLDEISTLATGHTPSRKIPAYWGGEIPWMSVGDARKFDGKKIFSTKEYTNELGIKNSAAVLLPQNTVCLSRTASIGYSIILGKPMATSQGFVNWICSDYLLPRYLQCIFLIEKQFLYEISEGTAHTTIYFPEVKAFHIALPPPSEQNRIVIKLDALFAKLETIKTSMATVPLLLKDFRQQVLESAFKINSKKVELISVCFKIQDGAHHSPKVTYSIQLTNTFPYITSKNIRNNYMKLDNVQYVDMDFHNTIYPRCTPEFGDVLLTKDGANTGNVTLNELDVPFSLLSSVCLIKTNKEKLIPSYLKYYFQSNVGLSELLGEMTGTAIKRIVLKKIKATKIPLPTIQEQHVIVSRVESLFDKANAIEKQYESLKAKIDNLPQAFLNKAFKGELSEQLDSDGDARELLKEIESLKNNAKSKSKEYKVPKEKLRLVAETK